MKATLPKRADREPAHEFGPVFNDPYEAPTVANARDSLGIDVDTDSDDGLDVPAHVLEETELPENHENQGELELVEAPRKTVSEAISYARVAKKIDVIALKHALSNQIAAASDAQHSSVSFKRLLQKLPSQMRDERTLADLSVQVCFITLLHLANERDFEITTNLSDDAGDSDDDRADMLAYPTDLLVHAPPCRT